MDNLSSIISRLQALQAQKGKGDYSVVVNDAEEGLGSVDIQVVRVVRDNGTLSVYTEESLQQNQESLKIFQDLLADKTQLQAHYNDMSAEEKNHFGQTFADYVRQNEELMQSVQKQIDLYETGEEMVVIQGGFLEGKTILDI